MEIDCRGMGGSRETSKEAGAMEGTGDADLMRVGSRVLARAGLMTQIKDVLNVFAGLFHPDNPSS